MTDVVGYVWGRYVVGGDLVAEGRDVENLHGVVLVIDADKSDIEFT